MWTITTTRLDHISQDPGSHLPTPQCFQLREEWWLGAGLVTGVGRWHPQTGPTEYHGIRHSEKEAALWGSAPAPSSGSVPLPSPCQEVSSSGLHAPRDSKLTIHWSRLYCRQKDLTWKELLPWSISLILVLAYASPSPSGPPSIWGESASPPDWSLWGRLIN